MGLSDERYRDAMRRVIVLPVPAGEAMPSATEIPGFVSIVGQGCVKTVASFGRSEEDRTVPDVTVQFAKPGYFAGLTPVIDKLESGNFAAIAHVDSMVACVPHDLMREILDSATPLHRLGVFAYHARALSRLIYDKTILLTLDVKRRLLRELTELERMFPTPDAPGTIALALSHQDLSSLVGASREHVTRSLRQLAHEGRVYIERQRVRLLKASRIGDRRGSSSDESAAGIVGPSKYVDRITGSATQLGLPKQAAEWLMADAVFASYDAGERIPSTREMAVTCLVHGAARVMIDAPDGPATVWIARPWQFIGVGATDSASAARRAFWAIAMTPSIVATFHVPLLTRVLGMLSANELFRFLGYCHAALSRRLYARCRMLTLSNAERLLYQLHLLASDFPASAPDGTAIALPLGVRRELASLVGATPVAVTRAMNELIKAERIRIEPGGRIVVHDARPR
jgi:CRP-like cAMP-binding protein